MSTTAKALLASTAFTVAVASTPSASASQELIPPPPPNMNQEAGSAAASAARGSLGKTFTTSTAEREGKNPKALLGGDTKATGKPVAVYLLNPEFVKNGKAPIGVFSYAAIPYLVNGTNATVDSIFKDGRWKAANIASGQDESSFAHQANGDPLLYEPQINAWYAVGASELRALNSSAKKALGGDTITTQKYAQRVKTTYGNALPGSAYDKAGKAGGYQDAPASTATPHHMARNAGLATMAGAAFIGGGFAIKRRRASSERSPRSQPE